MTLYSSYYSLVFHANKFTTFSFSSFYSSSPSSSREREKKKTYKQILTLPFSWELFLWSNHYYTTREKVKYHPFLPIPMQNIWKRYARVWCLYRHKHISMQTQIESRQSQHDTVNLVDCSRVLLSNQAPPLRCCSCACVYTSLFPFLAHKHWCLRSNSTKKK